MTAEVAKSIPIGSRVPKGDLIAGIYRYTVHTVYSIGSMQYTVYICMYSILTHSSLCGVVLMYIFGSAVLCPICTQRTFKTFI